MTSPAMPETARLIMCRVFMGDSLFRSGEAEEEGWDTDDHSGHGGEVEPDLSYYPVVDQDGGDAHPGET
jgi:hypothetical protein